MYIANYLLESYGTNNRVIFYYLIYYTMSTIPDHPLQVTTLLDQVEIIFVPFVNPDGYVVKLYIYVCMYVCAYMYVCMYVCVSMYVCMYLCVCVCMLYEYF